MINKNILTVLTLLLVGSVFQVKAQTGIAVSGVVTDTYGNPLPGVVVTANNEDLYITDKNGQYSAVVDKSKQLVFSLIGFKQEKLNPSSDMKVVLKDDAYSTAEVVNLGYAKQYREVLSDAVATASGDDLGKSLSARLQNTFSGRFSGLMTTESSFEPCYESMSMYIRGFSTVHGGTPCIVVDGILYDSYAHDILYRISPEEVESISVLKDAAAQAIYGVKSASGVIVINTKRGTPGKLKIGVNISETLEEPSTRIHSFDSYTMANLRNQAAINDGRGTEYYYSAEDIQGMKEGIDPLYPNTNWYDMLVRDFSNMQRISLDATGGTDKVKFFSNFNVLHQGSFWNTDQTDYTSDNRKVRVNFRTNIDVKINKWIGAYMNLAGSVVKSHTPQGNVAGNASIYNLITYMPSTLYGPTTPKVYDEEGNLIEEGGLVTTTANITNSPYGMLNRSGYSNETNTNIYGQGGLKFDFSFVTPGLWAGVNVGYLSYITANMGTTQSYARYTRDSDWSDFNFTKLGTTLDTELSYSKGTAIYGYMSYKAEAGYKRDFGKNHVAADAFGTYQVMDDNTGNIGSTYDFRRVYCGAELMYDYDRRYAVKLSTGYSGSDYYPRATRFIWTPAVSAAWILSNEKFIKDNAEWLSMLKFRGSYGLTGNDASGYDRYTYKDQVTSTPGGNIGYLGYYTNETVYGNALLEPEVTTKWNAAIDLGLWNSFSVSFDYFQEKMDNGVYSSTSLVPNYQGIPLGSFPITNLAKFENKGWELSVGYNKRLNSNWAINVNGHLDYTKNKVVYVGESPYDDTYAYQYRTEGYPYGQSWGYLVDWSNGNGLYNFQDEINAGPTYSFGSPRLGDIKYQDLNEDGVIDEKDKAPIGHGSIPNYSFGLSAGFTYKNFEVSLLFQGLAGRQSNYSNLISNQSVGDGIYTETHLDAWTAEKWLNDEYISMPALSTSSTTNNQANDYMLKNSSFVRLKNAEISYTMPKKVSNFLGASAFKVSLSGQNLFTIDGMKTNDTPVEGDYLQFPIYRMYRVGINLTF